MRKFWLQQSITWGQHQTSSQHTATQFIAPEQHLLFPNLYYLTAPTELEHCMQYGHVHTYYL